jgi:trehalose-6-phosphatase
LLAPAAVESRVQEYMRARGYRGARLTTSPGLSAVHKAFQQVSVERGHIHFKQLYEFTVEKDSGETAVRYVLAKSVGWGWYGYHAFVIASRIGRHLPPVLGLRDGILYTEWLPGANHGARPSADPEAIITTLAGYVADRTRALRLAGDLAIDLDRDNQLKGVDLLADTLRRAYRHPIAAALRRPRLRQAIARRGGYPPTLIDGRMRPLEWITSNGRILKTDFEHHGLGKTELNVTDPAYDLAESVLHWGLSPGEEERLLAHYVSASGDSQVRDRMFLQKLTAALWACETALNDMKKPERFGRHAEMNELYLRARRFLTREIAHYCGRHCVPPKRRQWRGPLVVLDVDGVIDDWFFSFPTTTAAGMRAISMLNAHEMPIVLNSARTLEEISEYSEAYGLLGGAGEYGSALYDALTGRQRVLVSRESLEEVARIREALRQTPGVFVNDHYRYSVRAYTFERYEPTHLSRSIVTDLFRKLGTNRLRLVQTNTDSAIIAEEADKGTGLKALLSWVGLEDDETIAVGDSEPDLAMFRVAARSFAPRQIKCREAAATLGCRIARRPQQRGLLEIVRLLVHENRQYCSQCAACQHLWPEGQNLFLDLLESADDRGPGPLMTSLADPLAWRAFVE